MTGIDETRLSFFRMQSSIEEEYLLNKKFFIVAN